MAAAANAPIVMREALTVRNCDPLSLLSLHLFCSGFSLFRFSSALTNIWLNSRIPGDTACLVLASRLIILPFTVPNHIRFCEAIVRFISTSHILSEASIENALVVVWKDQTITFDSLISVQVFSLDLLCVTNFQFDLVNFYSEYFACFVLTRKLERHMVFLS